MNLSQSDSLNPRLPIGRQVIGSGEISSPVDPPRFTSKVDSGTTRPIPHHYGDDNQTSPSQTLMPIPSHIGSPMVVCTFNDLLKVTCFSKSTFFFLSCNTISTILSFKAPLLSRPYRSIYLQERRKVAVHLAAEFRHLVRSKRPSSSPGPR